MAAEKNGQSVMTSIAIIGTGIAGLSCAYLLHLQGYEVELFEANDYVGGHTHTISLDVHQQSYAVDTGFIVFNERSYPNFTKMLQQLQVATQPTDMSFSVYDPVTQFQYAGIGLNGLFAQRSHFFKLQFYRFLKDIARFHRQTKAFLLEPDHTWSLAYFLHHHQFDDFFSKHYLYPLIASLWSAPSNAIDHMPFAFVAHFFNNHALLQMVPDLPWQVVSGGSANYVRAILDQVQPKLALNTPITKICRTEQGCELYANEGFLGLFDEVIVATHSDQALSMLDKASTLEHQILSAFSYQNNEVILHQDSTLMPSKVAAWASWNARLVPDINGAVLTYNMNRLQNIPSATPFYVTLNAEALIDPTLILDRFSYSHPQYHVDSLAAQQRQQELNDHAGIYFCGAYWGYGFHEDGVNSALQVCQQLLTKLRGTRHVVAFA